MIRNKSRYIVDKDTFKKILKDKNIRYWQIDEHMLWASGTFGSKLSNDRKWTGEELLRVSEFIECDPTIFLKVDNRAIDMLKSSLNKYDQDKLYILANNIVDELKKREMVYACK